MAGMLEGTRVVNLATVGPAMRAARWLADYGADVVNVGAPSGMQIEPPFHSYSAHRGIRRTAIDVRDADGRDVLLRLTDAADVVIESFRPGVVDRLGIGYVAVSARNKRVVYCSTTGAGQTGPAAQRAGHDLDYLAVGGFLHATGRGVDGKPPVPGATVADSAAGGMHALCAILAALVQRGATGHGAYLDVSISEGVLALMALQIDEYLATGVEPAPGHGLLTGRWACYDTYETLDGKWLAVAAIEPKFWANLCMALGLERWIAHQLDDEVRAEVRADVATALLHKARDEWVALLTDADTCVAPVLDVPELVADAHFAARGVFSEVVHPDQPAFRQLAPMFAGMERPASIAVRPAGERHTDEILAEAGIAAADIEALRARGIVT